MSLSTVSSRLGLAVVILCLFNLTAGLNTRQNVCPKKDKCPNLPKEFPAYPDFACGYQKLALKGVYWGVGTVTWFCDIEGGGPSPDIKSSTVKLYDVGTPLKAAGKLVSRLGTQEAFDASKYTRVGTLKQGNFGSESTIQFNGAKIVEIDEKYSFPTQQDQKDVDMAAFEPNIFVENPKDQFYVYRVRPKGGDNLERQPNGKYYPCETPRPFTAEYWVYSPRGVPFPGIKSPLCNYA